MVGSFIFNKSPEIRFHDNVLTLDILEPYRNKISHLTENLYIRILHEKKRKKVFSKLTPGAKLRSTLQHVNLL